MAAGRPRWNLAKGLNLLTIDLKGWRWFPKTFPNIDAISRSAVVLGEFQPPPRT
jgi:hypothetical protein